MFLISPAHAYRAVYSLTLCVLSKREYPGFSWIYFKVNPIIMFFFLSQKQFDMDFVKWMCMTARFVLFFYSCFPLVYFSFMNHWNELLPVNTVWFSRETCPQTTASASSTLDWSLNTLWVGRTVVTTPGRDSGLYTTTSSDQRGWVNYSHLQQHLTV